ncbi:MAG: cobalamin biosynthesis protein, partial [Anaerolineae bacterium]|nr:cobalamin biosynthesis protein [Anaerolineae bacterium]
MHRLATILLALTLDLIVGDPPNRFHPVVLMGNWLSWGRRLAPADHRFWFGCGWTLAGIAVFALPWKMVEVASRKVARSQQCRLLRGEVVPWTAAGVQVSLPLLG